MDERYVYGAVCTWHGSIHETAQSKTSNVVLNGRSVGVSIPCCPHCGCPLMEYKNRKEWDDQATKFMADHPELPLYREWMEKMHAGPCVPLKDWDWRAAYAEFAGKVQ
jgi:hypothetical protein